ncbi:D-isomer specific 2-hydroxyacid dehydrogenase family protein [Clostridium felsineum]|uniref:D-isomer specific 2-hydroxyacid dehydrogenase family protein n=1 Tax=Clostridium felsineum TaxID=36839 RepID=UPI00098C72CF|nr:D-isomer specific 2-hydroxyacid dehydrogenase family protein [Clostridium felsineum]URZ00415.1 Phenyllactate dehydrogenase [Clostridium felsineum]
MKIFVYSHRDDETEYFEKFKKKYNVDMMLTHKAPTIETAELAKGFDCISIINTPINALLIKKFSEIGVKFISTRSIGYEHIDIKKAKELGIDVGNVSYSPRSVADYTVMMILMATRKLKAIMQNSSVQDYSLKGVQGKELHNLTVGVIGTGRIGKTVIKNLKGFECSIIAYDIHENEEVKDYAKYVKLDELIKNSDVITIHAPSKEENYHLINKNSISKMKDGIFIINTARGALINTYDLIDALEKGKIAGVALDVIENETGLYYNDLKCEVLKNRELAVLKSYSNVIITPHTAFYTDQAVSDMVENSTLSCIAFSEGKENPWKL